MNARNRFIRNCLFPVKTGGVEVGGGAGSWAEVTWLKSLAEKNSTRPKQEMDDSGAESYNRLFQVLKCFPSMQ